MLNPSKACREDIASLSTGNACPSGRAPYYEGIGDWWGALARTLKGHEYLICGGCPTIHTANGYAHLAFENAAKDDMGRVWFSWYQMPSYRWEIICYIC